MANRFCAKYADVEMPKEWTPEIWERVGKRVDKRFALVPFDETPYSIVVADILAREVFGIDVPLPPNKEHNSAFHEVVVVEVFLVKQFTKNRSEESCIWAHSSQLENNSFLSNLRLFWRVQSHRLDLEMSTMVGLEVSRKKFL